MEEAYALGIVREFLSRKNFKESLRALDKEHPRDSSSITSRSELCKGIRLEKLYRKNKEATKPLSTLLEVMIQYFSSKSKGKTETSECSRSQQQSLSDQIQPRGGSRPPTGGPRPSTSSSSQMRPLKSRVAASSSMKIRASAELPLRQRTGSNSRADKSEYDSSGSSNGRSPVASRRSTHKGSSTKTKVSSEVMMMEDLDSEEEELTTATSSLSIRGHKEDFRSSKPRKITTSGKHQSLIDGETAVELHKLIFGTASGTFNQEWLKQSFTFCDHKRLRFGLIQFKGGPCGVLAAVQAYVIKHLLLHGSESIFDPSDRMRQTALLNALSEIVWQARCNDQATVAIPSSGTAARVSGYKADGVTEKLQLHVCKSLAEVRTAFSANINQFAGKGGLIAFMHSVILSRTIDGVREDMDEPLGKLMGAHHYCTMDIVNLVLTGRAWSNLHNGDTVLGDGKDKLILKGVKERCAVGLLTLFEHYNNFKVGSYLKSPENPVWVINSESHFTVMFATDKHASESSRQVDVYYFDGLGRQDEEYHITIDTTKRVRVSASEMTSPIDHCIRTKWPNAAIDWNGSDPLY